MPREQITRSTMVPTDNPNVFTETPRRNLHVSWNPTGWVQVGIDVTIAELRSMLESAVREASDAAKITSDLDTESFPFRVVSDVIDRAEINRAIHVLRTARDKAYGRDE